MLSVNELFDRAGVGRAGAVSWGREIPLSLPGVYVVATTPEGDDPSGLTDCPLDPSALATLLDTRPGATIDGQPADMESLANRLSQMWVPGEPVVYIGLAGTSVRARVGQFYSTRIGACGSWSAASLRQPRPPARPAQASWVRRSQGAEGGANRALARSSSGAPAALGGAPPCLSDKRLTGCGSLRTSPLAMSCEERFAYRGLHRTSSRPGRRPSGSISARSATRQIGIRMSARTGSVRERFVSDGADSRDVDSSAARDESSRRGTDSGSNDRRIPRRSPRRASDSRRTPDSGSVRSRTAIRPLAHLRRFRDSLRAPSLIDLRTHACRAATCFERTVPASADI